MARWWLMSWGGEHMDGTGLFGCPRILFIPWMVLKRFGSLKRRTNKLYGEFGGLARFGMHE